MNYIRIDERLIHGQVLLKWLKKTGCRKLLIVDQSVADDPVIQSVLKMSVPDTVRAEFLTVEEGKEAIEREKEDVLILLRKLSAAESLVKSGISAGSINIGRLPYSKGKEKICDNVYVSEEEKEEMKRLLTRGIRIFVQMVPDSGAVNLTEAEIEGGD